MYKKSAPRDRQLIIRVSGAEFVEIVAALEASASRSMSEFCRDAVLREARHGFAIATRLIDREQSLEAAR